MCVVSHFTSVVRGIIWFSVSTISQLYGICDILFSDSTRSLYEKKLKEAMAKGKRPKTSPDKTYYREEGNVWTDFHLF